MNSTMIRIGLLGALAAVFMGPAMPGPLGTIAVTPAPIQEQKAETTVLELSCFDKGRLCVGVEYQNSDGKVLGVISTLSAGLQTGRDSVWLKLVKGPNLFATTYERSLNDKTIDVFEWSITFDDEGIPVLPFAYSARFPE